jgi:uncharacterized protein YqhQ
MAVGGQAVLEGVMMRAPGVVATAVRRANGTIELKKEVHRSLGERFPFFRLPVLRGAVGLVEMMVIGIRTLNFSAEIATQDMETEQGIVGNGVAAPRPGSPRERLALAATVVLSLTIGVAVFFVTPLALTTWFFDVEQEAFWFNMIAGGVRIGLLLVYLAAISMIEDIRRLFEYHGAEHKAVFAFEKGEGLTIEACARQSRFHPRCGTSFLLIVMCSAILLFSILDAILIQQFGQITVLMRIATHLPLIPLVGGISYEFIRTSAKHSETTIGRIVVAPGLWLQKITTREPDASQLEVAIAALKAALGEDEQAEEKVLTEMAPA